MREPYSPCGRYLAVILLLSIALAGCLPLAGDITPPPEKLLPSQIPATLPPTQEPAQVDPQSAADTFPEHVEEGIVTVDVIDQTGGSLLEEGIEVRLEGYDQFDLAYQDIQPINSELKIRFKDVPFQTGRVFFASIAYGGAVYRSDFVETDQETTSLSLRVQIFETTQDDSGLVIDRVHVLIDFPQPDLAQIVEIYIFSNLGDATLVAETPGQPSVLFPLPPDAMVIEFDDGALGQRYIQTQDGFGDTVSIPPSSGVYQVLVYYLLPYQNNQLDFSQVMNYPVGAVVVMTPAGKVKVTGSTLEDLGVQNITNGAVHAYSGTSIFTGDSLKFRVSGKLDVPSATPESTSTFSREILIAIGVFGAVLFLSGLWLYFRNLKTDSAGKDQGYREEQRDRILDSIIALEDLYKQGEITEKVFLKKRQELKDQLSSLVEG